MKKLTMSIGALTLLVASSASAAWSGNTVIDMVEVNDGAIPQTFLGFLTTPSGKPAGCSSANQALISGTNAEAVKALTSVATAAYLAGRTVRVNWNGCSAAIGGVQYPLVIGLQAL